MTKEEIEKYTWDFLKSKQLADEVSSAIMGNIEAESEFDPNLVEVGTSVGFGLCQWSYERREHLEAYGTSLDHQLNFLWAELTGGDSSIGANNEWIPAKGYDYNMFMTNQYSIDEATKAFCWCWERPNEDLAHIDRRINSAYYYYELFKGDNPNPPTPSGTSFKDKVVNLNSRRIYLMEDSLFGRMFTTNKTLFYVKNHIGSKLTVVPCDVEEKEISTEDEEGNITVTKKLIAKLTHSRYDVNKSHARIKYDKIDEVQNNDVGGGGTTEPTNSNVEKAVLWAIDIANDDSHGYSQPNRWSGIDYDCSSFVLSAFHYAGFDVPLDGYTETMVTQFPNAGFEDITSQIDLTTGEGLIRGDVLLNHATHTAIYIGNGQMVDARIDEVGGIQGEQMGDQTGEEIMIHNYNNHPWTHVFRYPK